MVTEVMGMVVTATEMGIIRILMKRQHRKLLKDTTTTVEEDITLTPEKLAITIYGS